MFFRKLPAGSIFQSGNGNDINAVTAPISIVAHTRDNGEKRRRGRFFRVYLRRQSFERIRAFFYKFILHQQFSRTLVIPSGILSLTINSQTRSALMDSDPIEVLGATHNLERLWKQMTENEIVYDEDSFPIGGTHVDYDNHHITLWHSIDSEIDRIELPSFWAGWTLTDYRRDYKGFHNATPSHSTIIAPSEKHYVDSIREWVCHNDVDYAIPHGMDPSFAEKAFAAAVSRRHAS